MSRTGSVGASYPIWAETVRIAVGVSSLLALLGAVVVAIVAILGVVATAPSGGRDLVLDSAMAIVALIAVGAAILLGLWFVTFAPRQQRPG
ncbi:MAG TPA: hypothetical protein VGV64_07155 [Thermoplasmata archaeon]|nr:hypothetical protein [Thermoplasmata archaeon]HZY70058.1 hypothetical protein [Thermoplasmata archaeon]